MTPGEQSELERRRKSRATVTAIILGALVVLIFALAIAKIQIGWAH